MDGEKEEAVLAGIDKARDPVSIKKEKMEQQQENKVAGVENTDVMAMLTVMMERLDENAKHLNQLSENTRETNENIGEVRETLKRGLAEVQERAKQYTDERCAVLGKDIQEANEACAAVKEDLKVGLDECHSRIEILQRAIQDQVEMVQESVQHHVKLERRGGSDAGLPDAGLLNGTEGQSHEQDTACGAAGLQPLHTPPASPANRPAPQHNTCDCLTPPYSPSRKLSLPGGVSGRRKPSEFDGKVQWEAYFAQFELLAGAQGWDKSECALQLVASLRGAALEVLGHLTSRQRTDYHSVVEALRRKFGNYQQAEVYRARLKGRVRTKGESLPQLAQDIDTLVRRAYPTAPEDMVGELTTEYFVDALQNRELQLYVKQAHPKDMKEALARALELEAFTRTSVGGWSTMMSSNSFPTPQFKARRAQVPEPPSSPSKKRQQQPSSGRSSPAGFRGTCWGCGQVGHMRSQCQRGRRTRSLERPATHAFQPCCQNCGDYGHFSIACKKPEDIVQAGNDVSLAGGAMSQPAMMGPIAI